jgi:uncharacterized membrane protein YozB (DUF420 family)
MTAQAPTKRRTTQRRTTPHRTARLDLRVPALLLVLSVVPVIGGVVRLRSLSGGAAATLEDARFLAAPLPVVVHVFAATLYCLLGAFQFSAELRRRWPRWHRRAGKVLAACGLLVGFTGVWMTLFYPIPAPLQGPLLYCVRAAVGAAMVLSIVLGWRRILQRDVRRHEAWMIRAYALAQGAGTQVLVLLPWMLLSGESGGVTRDVLMTLAWVINLAAAESIIRWRDHGAVLTHFGIPTEPPPIAKATDPSFDAA